MKSDDNSADKVWYALVLFLSGVFVGMTGMDWITSSRLKESYNHCRIFVQAADTTLVTALRSDCAQWFIPPTANP